MNRYPGFRTVRVLLSATVYLALIVPARSTEPTPTPKKSEIQKDESSVLFECSSVVRLQIEVPQDSVKKLSRAFRTYVPAKIREGDSPYLEVGIHLKGQNGSYQTLNAKPSLSVKFDAFKPGQRF